MHISLCERLDIKRALNPFFMDSILEECDEIELNKDIGKEI